MTQAGTKSSAIYQRFLALHPRLIDLSLDRMWGVLSRLGDPHKKLPPVIHVAGTNGKGSTIAFMRAMLEASGRLAHVYTSPHLVRFHERFRIGQAGGGRLVSEAALADAFQRCEDANGGVPITVFEITTAAGLLLFSERPADVLLLEVGLGGQFDATNVIDKPACAVITPVSFDHVEFLGDTIARIAAEKAGILKRGCPGVIAQQTAEGLQQIERQAAKLRAPLTIHGQDFMAHEENGRLVYQDSLGLLDLPLPRLAGRHQHGNAAAAIAALRTVFGHELAAEAIETGLLRAQWPARLQRLRSGALISAVPAGAEIWLDGGHNADGGKVLSEAIAELEDRQPRPLVMIAGMLNTKDSAAFFAPFEGLAREVITVAIPGAAASRSAEDTAAQARQAGLRAKPAESLDAALRMIAARTYETAPRILLTGSLYFAGHVLSENGTIPD